ncbi:MAG: TonB-dependent receptor [Shimia sp.]|nr:TonB-dependent receptor [Shimia sp.]
MTRLPLRFALLAGTALTGQIFVLPATAQEAEEEYELQDIRIEVGEAQKVLGNLEITEEDLEQRNPASIKDVFAGESAISASGGASIAQKVFVNGVEESLLNVTIDGARQNKSAFHHTGNVLIDPGLLKSVEVSSGLSPADQGLGGLGGAIAYTTKDASDLLEDGDTFGGRFTLGAGSNGYGLRSSLALYGQQGGFDYLLNVTRHSGDDYKDGNGHTVLGTEPDVTDLTAKVSYTTDTGHKFAFSASDTQDTGMRAGQAGPGGLIFIRPDFDGTTSGPSVLVEGLSRRTSYSFTYTTEDSDSWYDPFVQIAYNEQEIDAGGVWGVNTSLSGTFKNTFHLSNGTVSAGLDFFDESAEGRTDAPFNFTGTEKLRNVGVFAQARQDLSNAISVSYGMRYDWQDFTGADGSKFTDDGLSANAAVDIALTDTLSLNAGYASTWGGYELGEAALINFFTPWDYTGFKASRGKSARVGLRFDNGTWQATGALFRTDIRDVAAVLPTGGARGVTTDVLTEGFDSSLAYFWGNGFARAKYTFADVSANGAPIGTTAYYLGRPMGHIVALETAFQPTSEWTIGGSAEIAPKFTNTTGSSDWTSLDAYSVFNLYAEYTPASMEKLRVRLDVRNLFDEAYVARGNDAGGSTAGRANPLTEPGRTITLTANITF